MSLLSIVAELPSICPPGARVIDLGAGPGRNAIFLASHGLSVHAVDGWAPNVDELNGFARERALPLVASVRDLNESTPDCRDYDVVVCTLVLHLLKPGRAKALLASTRSSAPPGAVHAIAAITSDGDFARECVAGERYFPRPGELGRAYVEAGWDVRTSFERPLPMRELNVDGTKKRNVVSFVLASKPVTSHRNPTADIPPRPSTAPASREA